MSSREYNLVPFSLSVARFAFTLQAVQDATLPPYLGSTLRGAMGRAFRDRACMARGSKCDECMFRWQCAYAYIFETARSRAVRSDHTEQIQPIPHPFVLEPPLDGRTHYRKGGKLAFSLVLIGKGIQFLPFFISAFEQAARDGLGAARHPFRLESVDQVSGECCRPIWTGGWNLHFSPQEEILSAGSAGISEAAEDLGLSFLTPTRLLRDGSLSGTVPFTLLMQGIFRRLNLLGKTHGDGMLDISMGEYLDMAERVRIQAGTNALHWKEWARYSNRQQQTLKMGGLVGEISYTGPVAPFIPYLKIAEAVHVGKGTVFGLGHMKVLGM